jgi:hypothetical protein
VQPCPYHSPHVVPGNVVMSYDSIYSKPQIID